MNNLKATNDTTTPGGQHPDSILACDAGQECDLENIGRFDDGQRACFGCDTLVTKTIEEIEKEIADAENGADARDDRRADFHGMYL